MSAHLGPGVLLAEQVGIEVGHLPLALVGEAPHQLPVAHVVELLPVLLGLTALLEPLDGLQAPAGQPHGPATPPHRIEDPASSTGLAVCQAQGGKAGCSTGEMGEFWPPVLGSPTNSHFLPLSGTLVFSAQNEKDGIEL